MPLARKAKPEPQTQTQTQTQAQAQAQPQSKAAGVQAVVEKALRAAGLMSDIRCGANVKGKIKLGAQQTS